MSGNAFGAGSSGPRSPESALQALLKIASTRMPVRVHIEGTRIRFNAQIAVTHNGSVMVTKPFGLGGMLVAGTRVRLRVFGPRPRDLHLEVGISHFDLSDSKAAFICKPPESGHRPDRKAERYETLHNPELLCAIGGESYRLVDISTTGLKICLLGAQQPFQFPLGREIRPAQISLGPDARIELERIVPRNYQGRMVGCDFEIGGDENSMRNFYTMMQSVCQPA